MNDWSAERSKLELFLGRTVRLEIWGYTYDWHFDTSVSLRNDDHKPFLLAWPIKHIPDTNRKPGHLRGVQVFNAESLPDKP